MSSQASGAVRAESRTPGLAVSYFRTGLMILFWVCALPVAGLLGFPWTLLTGNVAFLYRMAMWGAFRGVRIAGVKVRTLGLERIDPARAYIYMSNHASNLDPPLLLPLIPQRTSVLVKRELFKVPILSRAMLLGQLVPVDRSNRDAGIQAVRAASEVIRRGTSMTIYIEGKRSYDGRLLPFKKGPFYLAMQSRVPVVPITIAGTHAAMPKGRLRVQPGKVTVTFHEPIEPEDFGDRDALMARVRSAIDSGLPDGYREHQTVGDPQ
jgi:1-acyl-sn-glycerol-3-phosphate acyltransferase